MRIFRGEERGRYGALSSEPIRRLNDPDKTPTSLISNQKFPTMSSGLWAIGAWSVRGLVGDLAAYAYDLGRFAEAPEHFCAFQSGICEF